MHIFRACPGPAAPAWRNEIRFYFSFRCNIPVIPDNHNPSVVLAWLLLMSLERCVTGRRKHSLTCWRYAKVLEKGPLFLIQVVKWIPES
jgi:hypothetical protein